MVARSAYTQLRHSIVLLILCGAIFALACGLPPLILIAVPVLAAKLIAAAALICEEAGATVTDALGDPLRFNRPQPTAFGLLCAAPGIHGAAQERLAPRAQEILGRG